MELSVGGGQPDLEKQDKISLAWEITTVEAKNVVYKKWNDPADPDITCTVDCGLAAVSGSSSADSGDQGSWNLKIKLIGIRHANDRDNVYYIWLPQVTHTILKSPSNDPRSLALPFLDWRLEARTHRANFIEKKAVSFRREFDSFDDPADIWSYIFEGDVFKAPPLSEHYPLSCFFGSLYIKATASIGEIPAASNELLAPPTHRLCQLIARNRDTEVATVFGPEAFFSTDLEPASDYELAAGGVIFPVRREIIASGSVVFETVLDVRNQGFVENRKERYRIEGYSAEAVEKLIVYCYFGIAMDMPNVVFELVKLAEMYLVQDLVLLCESFLIQKVSSCVKPEELKIYEDLSVELNLHRLLGSVRSAKSTLAGNGVSEYC